VIPLGSDKEKERERERKGKKEERRELNVINSENVRYFRCTRFDNFGSAGI